MKNYSKLLIAVTVIILVLIAGIIIFHPTNKTSSNLSKSTPQSTQSSSSEAQVVSTVPAKLDNSTISPTQSIEITFNKQLLDSTHTRLSLDPNTPYHIILSSDGRTVQVIPSPQFNLGQNYILSIQGDTKLRDDTNLGKDFSFHFTTITYSGV